MTQMQTIAKHMVEYGHITRNTAIGMYQITRLAAVIQKMEAHGVPIIAEPVISPTAHREAETAKAHRG